MRTVRTPLLALAALAVVTSGCSAPADDTGNSSTTKSTGSASGSSAAESVTTLTKDDAAAAKLPDAIKKSGVIKVASGISFPPMEFFDTDNTTALGFDPDLGKALGQVLGVKFEFQNTNFDGIIGGLDAGRYDLGMTSMIDKKARQKSVDFVDYLESGIAFMVKKGNPAGLKSVSDLCGKKVAVEKAATGDLTVDDINKDQCKSKNIEKVPFPDQASAVQALQAGRADAVMALDLTLAYNVKQNPNAFEVPGEPIGKLPIGMPVPKKNTALRDAVQAALKIVQDKGVYDQLLNKWNLKSQSLTGAPINKGE